MRVIRIRLCVRGRVVIRARLFVVLLFLIREMLHLILVIVPIQKLFPHRVHPPIYLRAFSAASDVYLPFQSMQRSLDVPVLVVAQRVHQRIHLPLVDGPPQSSRHPMQSSRRGCLPHALQSH
ncbi:hypothetical protein B0H13DRAFT_2173991 [Mycena leptocephala]|nr:hypothetical protein B0H13DRAFT_2173991 [Mycena leptocephala]